MIHSCKLVVQFEALSIKLRKLEQKNGLKARKKLSLYSLILFFFTTCISLHCNLLPFSLISNVRMN